MPTQARQLEIRVKHQGDIAIVSLRGAVDASNLDDFKDALDAICEKERPKVLLECRDLSYANSTSFGLLFHFHRACEAQQGQFVLCSVKEKVRNILRLLGLENVLQICGSRQEALAALRGETEPGA